MACGGIQLQVVQDRPPQHVRQENVKGDCGRQILARERQCRLAAIGHDALEPLVARKTEEHAGVMRVIVHDEQHVVIVSNLLAVVLDHLFDLRDECREGRSARPALYGWRVRGRCRDGACGTGVRER